MTDTNDTSRPLILVTNDDGYQAAGIKALARLARDYGDVLVVAPLTMQSAKSNALTFFDPVRVVTISDEPGLRVMAVSGTPTDCVKLALSHFTPDRRPRLVLSGINHGFNTGTNVLYSGTMGAAFEAALHQLPCVALSLGAHDPEADFTPCLPVAKRVIETVLAGGLPQGVCLNVNIPNVPEVRGIKVTATDMGVWQGEYERRIDPHNVPYYWAAGTYAQRDPNDATTDSYWVERGYAAVTPCQADPTAHAALAATRTLLGGA